MYKNSIVRALQFIHVISVLLKNTLRGTHTCSQFKNILVVTQALFNPCRNKYYYRSMCMYSFCVTCKDNSILTGMCIAA